MSVSSRPPISPFLLAKHAWESGDGDRAVGELDALLGGREGAPAVYLPTPLVESAAGMRFEDLTMLAVATDEHLLIPFPKAIEALWNALPAEYVLGAMNRREADQGDLDDVSLGVLDGAAAQGMLWRNASDSGLVGKLLLRAEDYPHLVARVDLVRLDAIIAAAVERDAWSELLRTQGDLIGNLLLYAVFHKARRMDANLVLDALDRILERQPDAAVAAAEAFRRWMAEGIATDEIVRAGMRSPFASAECLASLVVAIEQRDPDLLADGCLPEVGR